MDATGLLYVDLAAYRAAIPSNLHIQHAGELGIISIS